MERLTKWFCKKNEWIKWLTGLSVTNKTLIFVALFNVAACVLLWLSTFTKETETAQYLVCAAMWISGYFAVSDIDKDIDY